MDFYLTTSASTLPCFQITWIMASFEQALGLPFAAEFVDFCDIVIILRANSR